MTEKFSLKSYLIGLVTAVIVFAIALGVTLKITSKDKVADSVVETVTVEETTTQLSNAIDTVETEFDYDSVPKYSGRPYVKVNDNEPYFTDSDLIRGTYEYYSELDYLGRCGVVEACINQTSMPGEDETQSNTSGILPTGWQDDKYDFIEGGTLYERCSLLGWQLIGKNKDSRNLITGTEYMNNQGILRFEKMTADYIKETDNHE